MAKANDFRDRLQISSEHKLRAENLPFDIDVWYPALKDYTYFTKFRPLTIPEAKSLMAYYERRFMERKLFTKNDVKILENLENDLDKKIKKYFPNGAFLRLCGRSPKDAEPLDIDKLRENYKKNYNSLLEQGFKDEANTKLIAISRVNWMRVSNGKEAMSLLLTSERVFTDLHDWILYGEPEQIVLREFDENLTMDYEFRAFINNNKINALSQYDHYSIFPYVEEKKEKIQEKIFEKWNEVHPFVGQKSYVMDFIYHPDTNSVSIIEISPFLQCTGAALFSWNETRDILENGPFEFRFNHYSHPQLDEIVESNWELRWNQKIPKYYELYEFAYPNPNEIQNSSFFNNLYQYFLSFFYNTQENKEENEKEYLFVYGTLKKGFHWNKKFLSFSKFIGNASSIDKFPLVFGDCNVPYLLNIKDEGFCVKGEVWEVDQISLSGMDDYEGVNKGYYSREKIHVLCNGQDLYVNVYFKLHSDDDIFERKFHEEYTLEYHQNNYQPIRHIQVKQKQYLGVKDEHHKT